MAVKRFYETFHPDHYDLYIDVDRAARKFSGTSTIHGDIKEDTVLVHQKYMTISKVTVDGKDQDRSRQDWPSHDRDRLLSSFDGHDDGDLPILLPS